MNEAQEIDRDIYSGMVAEELAKNGYYGEDLTLYGFAESANGGRGVHSSMMKKNVLSPISSAVPSAHCSHPSKPFTVARTAAMMITKPSRTNFAYSLQTVCSPVVARRRI